MDYSNGVKRLKMQCFLCGHNTTLPPPADNSDEESAGDVEAIDEDEVAPIELGIDIVHTEPLNEGLPRAASKTVALHSAPALTSLPSSPRNRAASATLSDRTPVSPRSSSSPFQAFKRSVNKLRQLRSSFRHNRSKDNEVVKVNAPKRTLDEFRRPDTLFGVPITWEHATKLLLDSDVPEYLQDPIALLHAGGRLTDRVSKGVRYRAFPQVYKVFETLAFYPAVVNACFSHIYFGENDDDTFSDHTIYEVRLYLGEHVSGTKQYTMNDIVPLLGVNDDMGGSTDEELWPLLLEKALALHFGGYETLASIDFITIMHACVGGTILHIHLSADLTPPMAWLTLLGHSADGDIILAREQSTHGLQTIGSDDCVQVCMEFTTRALESNLSGGEAIRACRLFENGVESWYPWDSAQIRKYSWVVFALPRRHEVTGEEEERTLVGIFPI